MLDNGRRYFSPAWIKRRIRELAYLKLNQLHLHFSDNQGFRIESEQPPGDRVRAAPDQAPGARHPRVRAAHHVRVIPELDMPGHMQAALAAHPELQVPGRPTSSTSPSRPPAASRAS